MIHRHVVPGRLGDKEALALASPLEREVIFQLARDLGKARILHLNATASGGGVAELLSGFIPYLRAMGMEAEWYELDEARLPQNFFALTNRIHNALQGSEEQFSQQDWDLYLSTARKIAVELMPLSYDLLVVHDPQPLPVSSFLALDLPSMLVLHLDTSHPDQQAWNRILPFLIPYKKIVFSNEEFVNPQVPKERVAIIPPAIDALAAKQQIVPASAARSYLAAYGVPETGPLLVQISRFDVWKNPAGVIEAFKSIQQDHPEARLLLVGFEQAADNPQARTVYASVSVQAAGDPNVFLFFDPRAVDDPLEFSIMAQNAADIVIQNSKREGFGLTVAEALWKRKPVIGGPASGIRRQIEPGKNGLIAQTSQELAEHMDSLLRNPEMREQLGFWGREGVKKEFLMHRYLRDYLELFSQILLR